MDDKIRILLVAYRGRALGLSPTEYELLECEIANRGIVLSKATTSRTRAAGGPGLGLAISMSIAQSFGGDHTSL